MSDLANSLHPAAQSADAHKRADGDSAVFTWFGVILLGIALLTILALPHDLAKGVDYVPSLFGP